MENELARIVVDCCYRMHSRYGPGLLESVYEQILFYELSQSGLFVERQKSIPLIHEDLIIPVAFRADLIIEGKLLLELKAVDEMPKLFYKKVVTYLKLTGIHLGLLINFNEPYLKDGIKRIVNNL